MAREPIVTEAERKILEERLPLINRIRNGNLRDMVIEVWTRLWRESSYGDICAAPNYTSEINGEETLVRHTNAVVEMSQAVAREFQRAYDISLNYDTLLAGAIPGSYKSWLIELPLCLTVHLSCNWRLHCPPDNGRYSIWLTY